MKLEYKNRKDGSYFALSCFASIIEKSELINDECYRVVWTRDGDFSMEADGISYELEKDQIFFLTPLNKVRFVNYSKNALVFSFNREFYCIRDNDYEVSCIGHLFFGSSTMQIISLNEKEKKSFELLYNVFLEEFENIDLIQGEMLHVLLKRLIILCTRIAKKNFVEPDMPENKLDIIRQFNVLVEQNFRTKHKVADYAEILNKSPKTISNLFAQYNEKTPLQIIQERKILEAKRLFIFTDKTAKEVAYDLGFDDAAHFSRFFKNSTGQSPSDFRKNKVGHN